MCKCLCVYVHPLNFSAAWNVSNAQIMEQRNNDVLRTLYILRLQSSVISVSENVIFYLQRRNSGPVNWRKQRFLSYEAML